MRKILSSLAILLISFAATADDHGKKNADLHKAIEGFNTAYETNDVPTYFSYYAKNPTVHYGNARQDVNEYHKFWIQFMANGGGVELNEMSDIKVQTMAGGKAAVVTSFVKNRTRSPDGTVSTANAFETDVWEKIDGKWKIVSLHYHEIPKED